MGLTKDSEFTMTSSGQKEQGTARWKAPELMNDEPKSVASDVYAFAMLMVEVSERAAGIDTKTDGHVKRF